MENTSSNKRLSSCMSTGSPRKLSVVSITSGVPVIVHVADLLESPSNAPIHPKSPDRSDQKSRIKSLSVRFENTIDAFPIDPPSNQARNSISSLQSDYEASQEKIPVEEPPEQEIEIDLSDGYSNWKDTKSVYSVFPSPVPLDHFDKWFPEVPQEGPDAQEPQTVRFDKSLPPPPYHVFERGKKLQLVILVSLAGILSPVSTSIYFPALMEISKEFKVSNAVVLLTVTVYMAIQGIAPFFWMPFCGSYGRRPIFIATLLVFLSASIGLVYSNSFILLLILRGIQSIGSAALTATCAAVIGDISTAKERSKFIGLFGGILMFTFISPVVGGILTYYLGFRSIFWFLLVFSGLVLILVVLLLPETLRTIAGNGTIRLKPVQQPLINVIRSSKDTPFDSDLDGFASSQKNNLSIKNFVEPLYCLLEKTVLASIFYGALAFAICTAVIATTAAIFEDYYFPSSLLIGLAFIPAGAGSVISFFFFGYLMDHDLRVTKEKYRALHDLEKELPLDHKSLADFPIERARLRNVWWILFIFISSTAGYGFTFSYNMKSIAGPLILQFLIAASATALLLLNGVLVADLYTGNVSVTAAVNLVRFSMGALAVGVVQLMSDRIGTGFTFLTMAMIMLLFTPLLLVQWVFGRPWRAKRDSTWPREKLSKSLKIPDVWGSFKGAMGSIKNGYANLPTIPDTKEVRIPFFGRMRDWVKRNFAKQER